jgi:hypothetical protein
MQLNQSRDASNCTANQERINISWNQKVHYHGHMSPPPVPIVSQINTGHNITSYLAKIQGNIIHSPSLCLSSDLFPSGFPARNLYIKSSVA